MKLNICIERLTDQQVKNSYNVAVSNRSEVLETYGVEEHYSKLERAYV